MNMTINAAELLAVKSAKIAANIMHGIDKAKLSEKGQKIAAEIKSDTEIKK